MVDIEKKSATGGTALEPHTLDSVADVIRVGLEQRRKFDAAWPSALAVILGALNGLLSNLHQRGGHCRVEPSDRDNLAQDVTGYKITFVHGPDRFKLTNETSVTFKANLTGKRISVIGAGGSHELRSEEITPELVTSLALSGLAAKIRQQLRVED